MSFSGAQVTRLWPYGGPGHQYGSFAGKATSPPVFAGTIPDISENEDTGLHQYDLGAYFSGATSYGIAPAVEAGWTFDTVTGELEIDTDATGTFGPFIVTGTNIAGSDDSNAFSVTVVAVAVVSEQPSGGWAFLNYYESELQRRRKRQKDRERLEAETAEIQDALDRNIAQLLREQEAEDDKRADIARLASLAKQNADIEAARQYSERVGKAYVRALTQGNFSAIEALDRELKRAREEEEWLIMSLLLLAD